MLRRMAVSAVASLMILMASVMPSQLLADQHVSLNAFPLSTTAMPIGNATFSPLGHIEFCKLHPVECISTSSGKLSNHGRMSVSRKSWDQLVSVNSRINADMLPRSDLDAHHALDVWSLKGKYGDCEDYVIRKRSALIRAGWPSSSVLIATVREQNARAHAVLVARTSKGDFVLDNLNSKVRAWDKVPYRWLKRQSSLDPRKWVGLMDNPSVAMPARIEELKALKVKAVNRQAWIKSALAKLRRGKQQ